MANPGQQLSTGAVVRGHHSGLTYTVDELLGSGGQGEVYLVREGGQSWALKWYYPQWMTNEHRRALDRLVAKGAPNNRYLWPLELTGKTGSEPMGYVMPLREPRFKGLNDLVAYRIQSSFTALAIAGRDLADSFLQLHASGFCYRDISFGNVFFEPTTGEVLICDNDNVGIDGSDALIRGTPKFMAPEVVCTNSAPNARTDLYSLSVLLFYMFFRSHPLEGQREQDIRFYDDHVQTELLNLYGVHPVFIFDPKDESNRPSSEAQANAVAFWRIYPTFFRELFVAAFTKGLRDPNARVLEGVWRRNLIKLRDLIRYCPSCGAENFFDPEQPAAQSPACWRCRVSLPAPWRINLGQRLSTRVIVLNRDTQLCPYHLGDVANLDFESASAKVVQHPQRPDRFGIRNFSRDVWQVRALNGEELEAPPGSTVSMKPGTRINFGRIQGEIQL